MAIVTATELKALFNQIGADANDTMLAQAIASAQKVAEDYCGYGFDYEADHTEYHDSVYHGQEIYLDRRNVDTDEDFTLKFSSGWDWDDVDAIATTAYRVQATEGIVLLLTDYAAHRDAWQIVYTGGWTSDTAPDALKQAVGELTAIIYERMKSGTLGVESDQIGDNIRTYSSQNILIGRSAMIPRHIAAKLDGYRRWSG